MTSLTEDIQKIIDRISSCVQEPGREAALSNLADASRVLEGLLLRVKRLAENPNFASGHKPDCFEVAADLVQTPDAGIEFSIDISTKHPDKAAVTARIFARECYGVNASNADPITLLLGGIDEINPEGYLAMKRRADDVLGQRWCMPDTRGNVHALKRQPKHPVKNVKVPLCELKGADPQVGHSGGRGEAPFASHMLYPGALDDNEPAERTLGIEAGLSWGSQAEVSVVYTDRGVSKGMRLGIARAEQEGRPIEFRTLDLPSEQENV